MRQRTQSLAWHRQSETARHGATEWQYIAYQDRHRHSMTNKRWEEHRQSILLPRNGIVTPCINRKCEGKARHCCEWKRIAPARVRMVMRCDGIAYQGQCSVVRVLLGMTWHCNGKALHCLGMAVQDIRRLRSGMGRLYTVGQWHGDPVQ